MATRQRCKGCGELMHITATEERCKFCTLAEENKRLRAALAFYADPSSWAKDEWGGRSVINPPDYGKPGLAARQALGLPEPAEED